MILRKTVTTILIAACVVPLAGVSIVHADTYKIDPAHSSVTFAVKHMVISHVKGSFDKFDGTIEYDPNDITKSSVEVTIDAASINTNQEKRDKDLRSSEFLDVANHAAITFKSTSVRKTSSGLVASGLLTIRGVSKPIDLVFKLNGPIQNPWGQTVIGVEASHEINRKDYGVKWNKTLETGGLVVDDNVKIDINVEATKS